MTSLVGLLVAALVWWPIRALLARRAERDFANAYPRTSDGFIAGAEPIHLAGTRRGAVLLLHGFNDSPQAVGSLARALHERGWTVHAPALAGHGRGLREFAASGSEAWFGDARAALAELRSAHDAIAVGGLSMGGAIAFVLAAEQPDVRAVVGLAPYLHVSIPLRLGPVIAPIASLGGRYVASHGEHSVHDPAAAEAMIAYRRATPRLLFELERVVHHARRALPLVRQPVLVLQSREDNRIPEHSAREAFARIGSADKTLDWLSGTGHVVTVDYGHEALERRVADWLEGRLE